MIYWLSSAKAPTARCSNVFVFLVGLSTRALAHGERQAFGRECALRLESKRQGHYTFARREMPKSIDKTGLMVRFRFSENIIGAPINPHIESFLSSFVNGVFVDVIGRQSNARLAPWHFIGGKQDHSPSWIVQWNSFEIFALLFPFPLQIMMIQREKKRPRGQPNIEGWRASNVGQHEMHWHIRKSRWLKKSQRSSDGRLNFNPRPLVSYHHSQLVLHDADLSLHRFFRAVQNAPLQERGSEVQNRRTSYDPSRDSERQGIASKSVSLGVLVILIGWCLVGVVLRFANQRNKSRQVLAAIIAASVMGAIFMVHGLFFACTGDRFPLWPSASADRRFEDVLVLPVVITKLELLGYSKAVANPALTFLSVARDVKGMPNSAKIRFTRLDTLWRRGE